MTRRPLGRIAGRLAALAILLALPLRPAWAQAETNTPPPEITRTRAAGTAKPKPTPTPAAPRVGRLRLRGNDAISKRQLLAEMNTQARPWYRFWERRPKFVIEDLRDDVERLERFYEAQGRYLTQVRYALVRKNQNTRVDVDIDIAEAEAIPVDELHFVDPSGAPVELPPELLERLPLRRGAAFVETAYRDSENLLLEGLRDRGHARARVEREATVDVGVRTAKVTYRIAAGPECVYGSVTIDGNDKVARYIIAREVDLVAGEPFRPHDVVAARDRLLDLGLFSSVQILAADSDIDNPVVDLLVRVEERPFRDIRVGVGYGTQDDFRAQIRWSSRNFFGGGRRVHFDAKYSSLQTAGLATFIQPHLFSPHVRGLVEFGHDQQNEVTYLLNETRLRPRVEVRLHRKWTMWVGYRLARDQFNDVDGETVDAIGGFRRRGYVTGPSLGVVRDTLDDPLDPRRGGLFSLSAEQLGLWWGGDFDYYKLVAEMKRFYPIPLGLTVGLRAKIGAVDDLGNVADIPLHDRLYVGGDRSVRGYGRRKLGPRSSTGDPLGGRSALEGSFELRRHIWQAVGAAVFVDVGEVSLQRYDYFGEGLDFSAGFGVTYATPVGPLRLDVGFPFQPPGNDQAWQIHFSVGQYF